MAQRVAAHVECVVLRVKPEVATRHQVRGPHHDNPAQQQSFGIREPPGLSLIPGDGMRTLQRPRIFVVEAR